MKSLDIGFGWITNLVAQTNLGFSHMNENVLPAILAATNYQGSNLFFFPYICLLLIL